MSNNPANIRSVCVYCGSSPGVDPAFLEAATWLGEQLAENDIQLVYGGGDNGLMGAVARGALSRNGSVTGIIPAFLQEREQANGADALDAATMIVVPDMHTRKQKMFELADAFVALPGGIGTLEELVEIMTWAQLDRHAKPMFVLNTSNFWSPLLSLINHMADQGFLHNPEKTQLNVANVPNDILQFLAGEPKKVDQE